MTIYSLLGYLCACMALTVAPGPDNIFVITQGITRGRKAAIVTALGMCSGVSVHTTAAALGISAIFYSSAMAFNLASTPARSISTFLEYCRCRSL
jgi:threonine/homoserine/homoserine lactone efflux protein